MIEAPFCFFEMEVECLVRDAFEFGEPDFGKTPKALDAVDMHAASRELIFRMINSKMPISEIDKPIIASPAVRIDTRRNIHLASNNGL